MKVSYYCQHVLGIGHFHRSMEICKALAEKYDTTLILGGPKTDTGSTSIKIFQLPGLKMDHNFQNLVPCTKNLKLEDVKRKRQELLITHFIKQQPDVFITELYPFGRKAFRFELDPVLSGVQDGTLPPCQCYCSVRDILVEKEHGREKFEKRVVETLNRYFSGVFIHSDQSVITMDKTFGRMADITIPTSYTGFVSKPSVPSPVRQIRNDLKISTETKLIVASIGGGNVGGNLLQAVVDACNKLDNDLKIHLQLFCGPYCSQDIYKQLQKQSGENISVAVFSDNFPQWLDAADLSISMAGYNTCMNLLLAGIPSLVYPFRQNREQEMRAQALEKRSCIRLLSEDELSPKILKEKIKRMLYLPRTNVTINLDGARQTVKQLHTWADFAGTTP